MKDNRGLYAKYYVKRNDGSSADGQKHADCDYFVLDWEHDEFAIPAMKAYAKACAEKFPRLAIDLRIKIGNAEARRKLLKKFRKATP